MRIWRERLSSLLQFRSAVFGLVIIGGLLMLAMSTMFTFPYQEAITLWRGGKEVWSDTPRNAMPAWVNLLPGMNLPETIVRSSHGSETVERIRTTESGAREKTISFAFDYRYDGFPQSMTVFLESNYDQRRPFATVEWRTPDGREIQLRRASVKNSEALYLSQDSGLRRKLGGQPAHVGLFADPSAAEPSPLHGRYEMEVSGLLFEEGSDLEAKLVVYGRVYGLAGTDHLRRDLMVALLWGTIIALAFGILAAIGATVSTFIIAAIGVWYGSWVDAVIQRITEINLIIPPLIVLILVGTLYSQSIWVILGVVILLGIFSSGIKVYRAIFLPVKGSPYIEAAQAYGARDLRCIFRYLIPRVVPVLVPQFVILIPDYVFLEATLAVLGLGDPILPTWGKVLNDAFNNGALYNGFYYWVLEPAALLMVTGLGFAMVGFALDRIFNPRLRVE